MTHDILVTPLHHVSFDDTVAPPPLLGYHILFEWPLTRADPKSANMSVKISVSFLQFWDQHK